jgi:hypothetical protein
LGGSKDQLRELPDEVLDASRDSYAKAALYNSLAAWERRWGFESEGAIVKSKKVYADNVREAGEEANAAFEAAVSVLEHWLSQKWDEAEEILREGPGPG